MFKLPLLLLQCRCSVRGWQNVSLDEIVTVRAGIEAFLEVVGRALAFEFESLGLEGTVTRLIKDAHGIKYKTQAVKEWQKRKHTELW